MFARLGAPSLAECLTAQRYSLEKDVAPVSDRWDTVEDIRSSECSSHRGESWNACESLSTKVVPFTGKDPDMDLSANLDLGLPGPKRWRIDSIKSCHLNRKLYPVLHYKGCKETNLLCTLATSRPRYDQWSILKSCQPALIHSFSI